MAAKSAVCSAFDLLGSDDPLAPVPIVALTGDEGFLKRETRRALLRRLGDGEVANVLDEAAEWRDVYDALSARSLFGGERRVVVVESADKLVSNLRPTLEDYVARPFADATLVLEVRTWPATTRLAKAVLQVGMTVECGTPAKGRELTAFTRHLKIWLATVARRQLGCELKPDGADALLELLPTEAGVLYQEVVRLATLGAPAIDATLVQRHVGGWRTQQTWDMIDAAADGRAADALAQLDRLIAAGDDAHSLLPQMASTLRRFARAVRLVETQEQRGRSISLHGAVQQAGFMPFKLGDAERQLRQIDRVRARRLYRSLLEADLAIKGHRSQRDSARGVIETLILQLSREAQPSPAPSSRTPSRR